MAGLSRQFMGRSLGEMVCSGADMLRRSQKRTLVSAAAPVASCMSPLRKRTEVTELFPLGSARRLREEPGAWRGLWASSCIHTGCCCICWERLL